MRVALTEAAEEDLAAVYAYCTGRSGIATGQVIGAIMRAINGLARFPRMGGPGVVPETRERVMIRFPYRIVYHVNERTQVVEIWRVIHTRLEWPPSAGE